VNELHVTVEPHRLRHGHRQNFETSSFQKARHSKTHGGSPPRALSTAPISSQYRSKVCEFGTAKHPLKSTSSITTMSPGSDGPAERRPAKTHGCGEQLGSRGYRRSDSSTTSSSPALSRKQLSSSSATQGGDVTCGL
jgi:hypothetical protein